MGNFANTWMTGLNSIGSAFGKIKDDQRQDNAIKEAAEWRQKQWEEQKQQADERFNAEQNQRTENLAYNKRQEYNQNEERKAARNKERAADMNWEDFIDEVQNSTEPMTYEKLQEIGLNKNVYGHPKFTKYLDDFYRKKYMDEMLKINQQKADASLISAKKPPAGSGKQPVPEKTYTPEEVDYWIDKYRTDYNAKQMEIQAIETQSKRDRTYEAKKGLINSKTNELNKISEQIRLWESRLNPDIPPVEPEQIDGWH